MTHTVATTTNQDFHTTAGRWVSCPNSEASLGPAKPNASTTDRSPPIARYQATTAPTRPSTPDVPECANHPRPPTTASIRATPNRLRTHRMTLSAPSPARTPSQTRGWWWAVSHAPATPASAGAGYPATAVASRLLQPRPPRWKVAP